MKDTVITASRKKTELITLIVCFILANGVNIYAILIHNSPWKEVFTSIGFVLILTAALYLIWSFVRLVFCGIKRLFVKK